MKKNYKKILIFELIIIFTFIVNSFFIPFLTNTGLCIFLGIILFLFKFIFGFEKPSRRYIKDIMLNTTIYLLIFFMVYYVLGIFIGFTNPLNLYTVSGRIQLILTITISTVLKEILRYMMMCKSDLNKITTISTVIFFIFMEISIMIPSAEFSDNYSIFKFIAMVVMPAVTTNSAYCYITKKVGYYPIIYYSLIVNLYTYILPIVPNVNNYIYSMILLVLPCLFMFIVYNFFNKSDDNIDKNRDYFKKKYDFLWLIPSLGVILTLICLYSGYFRFWVVAIASGSMTPEIQKGDLVIIDKKVDKNNLKLNQVIAYKNENSIIVHRIDEIVGSKEQMYYITKGDANLSPDAILVDKDMIIGIVEMKIPYMGLPTIWIHEMLN